MKDLFLTPRGDLSIENIIDSKEKADRSTLAGF